LSIKTPDILADKLRLNIDYDPPIRKIVKGAKRATLIISYRYLLRMIVFYFKKVSVEKLLFQKFDTVVTNTQRVFKNGSSFVINSIRGSKVDAAPNVTLSSSDQIVTKGFFNLGRGYKNTLRATSFKIFYYVSVLSVDAILTVYNKIIGKDDDDIGLTIQKFVSHISYALGNIVGFAFINGAINSSFDVKRFKIFWVIFFLLLDLTVSPMFGEMFRDFMESNFLTRVENGKTRLGSIKGG